MMRRRPLVCIASLYVLAETLPNGVGEEGPEWPREGALSSRTLEGAHSPVPRRQTLGAHLSRHLSAGGGCEPRHSIRHSLALWRRPVSSYDKLLSDITNTYIMHRAYYAYTCQGWLVGWLAGSPVMLRGCSPVYVCVCAQALPVIAPLSKHLPKDTYDSSCSPLQDLFKHSTC